MSPEPFVFLYQAVALKTQESDEGILLLFTEGDVLLVYADEEEKVCVGVCVWKGGECGWVGVGVCG